MFKLDKPVASLKEIILKSEVMYHGLLYQREIDIPVGVAKLVKLVAANSGYDEAIIDATMQQYCLSEPAIKQARDLVTKTIEEK
ncbi:hypothetical protein H7R52_02260 [Weissella confusa]|uniref:Uncharacterized protein n=1 Tax=Weissella confusa TaxID=1583 RepID=A0A923SMP1_WEICO|nr:hypothetical protein [Weissella confusa]